jgi:hypothetical protein
MRPQERHKSGMPLLTAEQYQLVAEARRDPTIQRQLTYRRVLKENNFTSELREMPWLILLLIDSSP